MTQLHFDPAILLADPAWRQRILPVLEAAPHAVDPGPAVNRALQRAGSRLTVGNAVYDPDQFEHVSLLGFGKAEVAMGLAAAGALGERLTSGDLLRTGPTQTNVNDLIALFVL